MVTGICIAQLCQVCSLSLQIHTGIYSVGFVCEHMCVDVADRNKDSKLNAHMCVQMLVQLHACHDIAHMIDVAMQAKQLHTL